MEQKTILNQEMFNKLQKIIGISIPNDIVNYYLDIPRKNDDFSRMALQLINKERKPLIFVQIIPEFAIKIIKNIEKLNQNEIRYLKNELQKITNETCETTQEIISFILVDGVNLYNIELNKFQISIINKTYEETDFNTNNIKVLLCNWMHCGGWGGIVLRGKNVGYEGGAMHGHYLEVDYKGIKYEYNSCYHANIEQPYLIMNNYL